MKLSVHFRITRHCDLIWGTWSRYFSKTSFERSPEESIYSTRSLRFNIHLYPLHVCLSFDSKYINCQKVWYNLVEEIWAEHVVFKNNNKRFQQLILLSRSSSIYTYYRIYPVYMLSHRHDSDLANLPMSRHVYIRQTCLHHVTWWLRWKIFYRRHYRKFYIHDFANLYGTYHFIHKSQFRGRELLFFSLSSMYYNSTSRQISYIFFY